MKTLNLITFLTLSFFITTSVVGQDVAYIPTGKTEEYKVAKDDALENAKSTKLTYQIEWMKTNEVQYVDMTYIDRHFLGDEIAKKKYLLEQIYVKKVPIAPGNPATKIEITKPDLYNACNSIERYFRKGIRKGIENENTAREKLNAVLDLIINTYYIETTELEEKLRKTKSTEEMLSFLLEDVKVVLN